MNTKRQMNKKAATTVAYEIKMKEGDHRGEPRSQCDYYVIPEFRSRLWNSSLSRQV